MLGRLPTQRHSDIFWGHQQHTVLQPTFVQELLSCPVSAHALLGGVVDLLRMLLDRLDIQLMQPMRTPIKTAAINQETNRSWTTWTTCNLRNGQTWWNHKKSQLNFPEQPMADTQRGAGAEVSSPGSLLHNQKCWATLTAQFSHGAQQVAKCQSVYAKLCQVCDSLCITNWSHSASSQLSLQSHDQVPIFLIITTGTGRQHSSISKLIVGCGHGYTPTASKNGGLAIAI